MRRIFALAELLLLCLGCGRQDQGSHILEDHVSPKEAVKVVDDYVKGDKLASLGQILVSQRYFGGSSACSAPVKKILRKKIAELTDEQRSELIKAILFYRSESEAEKAYQKAAEGYEPEKLLRFAYVFPYSPKAIEAQAQAAAILLEGGDYDAAWTVYEVLWNDYRPEIEISWSAESQNYLYARMLAAKGGYVGTEFSKEQEDLQALLKKRLTYPLYFGRTKISGESELDKVIFRLRNIEFAENHKSSADRLNRADDLCIEKRRNSVIGPYLVNPNSEKIKPRDEIVKVVESSKVACALSSRGILECYSSSRKGSRKIAESIVDVQGSHDSICRLDKLKNLRCFTPTLAKSLFPLLSESFENSPLRDDLTFKDVENFTLSRNGYICVRHKDTTSECTHSRVPGKVVHFSKSIKEEILAKKPTEVLMTYTNVGYAVFKDGSFQTWTDNKVGESNIPKKIHALLTEKGVKKFLGAPLTCAYLKDDSVACWDSDSLKNGIVFDDGKITDVHLGQYFVCAMNDKKKIFCDGNETEVNTKISEEFSKKGIRSFASSPFAACALLKDNTVECIGRTKKFYEEGYKSLISQKGQLTRLGMTDKFFCGWTEDGNTACIDFDLIPSFTQSPTAFEFSSIGLRPCFSELKDCDKI